MNARCFRWLLLIVVMLGASAPALLAATLTDAAAKAYADYVERARRSSLDRVNQPVASGDTERAALHREETTVRPGGGDGIQDMPDSLLHHWRGTAFIPRI